MPRSLPAPCCAGTGGDASSPFPKGGTRYPSSPRGGRVGGTRRSRTQRHGGPAFIRALRVCARSRGAGAAAAFSFQAVILMRTDRWPRLWPCFTSSRSSAREGFVSRAGRGGTKRAITYWQRICLGLHETLHPSRHRGCAPKRNYSTESQQQSATIFNLPFKSSLMVSESQSSTRSTSIFSDSPG